MNPPTALLLVAVATATALAGVSARAVNISNTWVLPEEGFPVFYRYFRDRISWYEADAVCQFHHANLVTVDSTSQYDAIRAYLKELDITSNVWIGLQRNSDKPNFTWMDFRPLSADGHWQEAIPKGSEPLCVATDPAADFRWHALSCGGPAVASFICELPVPSWASGPGGCLLTEIPSLTVLYIPEQSALELTSDCGLDGTKRIACKGNADHDEMIKQLACTITGDDFEERSTKAPLLTSTVSSSSSTTHQVSTTVGIKTTKPWLWTSNTVDTGDYGLPTRHRRETEDTVSPTSTTRSASITKPSTVKPEMDYSPETTSKVTQTDVDNLTTQETSREEVFGTATVTTEAKDLSPEEYPSAINQGQLFSIIENGTVFDIIELNETGTEGNKAKDVEIQFTTTQTVTVSANKVETTNTKKAEILYTTVMYNKEPTQEVPPVTNEGLLKKSKDMHKQKNANDLSSKVDDKTLSKEVEMFPIVGGNSLIKLNRTNRKELPMMEDDENNPELNLDVDNKLPTDDDQSLHETIEIKLHHGHKTNSTGSVLFVTTKKATKPRKNSQFKATLNTTMTTTKIPEVTTTLENNSLSHNATSQEETQIISSRKHNTDWDGVIQEETSESTGEPLEAEPQAQPRPNRQRQLTRPQRKSFYPYFFSRMLG